MVILKINYVTQTPLLNKENNSVVILSENLRGAENREMVATNLVLRLREKIGDKATLKKAVALLHANSDDRLKLKEKRNHVLSLKNHQLPLPVNLSVGQ